MIELLAPAGSYEGFEGAVAAGADAVYVGGQSFGARAYAQNFTKEELLKAIDTAHIFGRKLYMTVNTLMKNRELEEEFYEYFLPFYEQGLDGVIVQDLGTVEYLKKYFPKMPLHASTQMTVTGPKSMQFLEEKGLKRVVTARELSLKETKKMYEESPLEIEAFIHGALCYCYSGQCLFSSMIGGRSGNRGRCAQPCRLNYKVLSSDRKPITSKEICPLSPRDICTLDLLPQILDAGIVSLKIEGRMKRPEYTAGVVAVYRKYLDLLQQDPEHWRVKAEDRKYLLDIFSRGGSCEGYFQQHNGPDMMDFKNEKKSAGVTVEIAPLKKKIYGSLQLREGEKAIFSLTDKKTKAIVIGNPVQAAKNQPMGEERIRKQMEKCGNSVFQWDTLDIQIEGNIFVSVGELNELRRQGFAALEEEILKPYRRRAKEEPENFQKKENGGERKFLGMYASCETLEQFNVLAENQGIQGIYAPYAVLRTVYERKMLPEKELYLSMPTIVRGEVPKDFWMAVKTMLEKGLKGFLVSCMEAYAVLREQGYASKCVIDHSIYTWNDRSVEFWKEEGVLRNTMPLELNEKELLHRDNQKSELLIYGYLPLMVSAQCVNKNVRKCTGRSEEFFLEDRKKADFPVKCFCDPWGTGKADPMICYNRIYNSLPFGLLKERQQVERIQPDSLRLSFTIESGRETKKIIECFLKAYFRKEDAGETAFTKGHFKRGVE